MDYGIETIFKDEVTIIFVIIVVIFLFLAFFVNVYLPFEKEKLYIKMEMKRSFSEDEYLYWKSELKHLYLKYIPFIGRFFK